MLTNFTIVIQSGLSKADSIRRSSLGADAIMMGSSQYTQAPAIYTTIESLALPTEGNRFPAVSKG
jgi:hypothetical protein